jgi:hypothetical protein
MPNPEDPQGRCANCIRLKKECNFYPVTEASQHEVRASSASRKSTQTSTPASPRTAGTSNQESADELRFPPSNQEFLPASQGESFGVPHTNGGEYLEYGGYVYLTRAVQYAPQSYGYPTFSSPEHWQAPGFPPSQAQVSSSQPDSVSPLWSPNHPVVSTAYQNSPTVAAGQAPPAPFESPGFPYNQSQNQASWGQPRSLSYGHIEGIQHQYSGYHPLSSHHSSQVQSPAFPPPYPHQLPSNHLSAAATEASPSTVHTPTTTQHLPSYPAYQQPAWTTYPQPAPLPSTHEPHSDAYSHPRWYSEPSPLTKPNEQTPATGLQYAQPPTYYSNVSHS